MTLGTTATSKKGCSSGIGVERVLRVEKKDETVLNIEKMKHYLNKTTNVLYENEQLKHRSKETRQAPRLIGLAL